MESSYFFIGTDPADRAGIVPVLAVAAAMLFMATVSFMLIFRRKDKKS